MYYHQPKNTYISMLNSSLGGLTFAQDTEGNWGYKPSGADSVLPFNGGVRAGTIQCSTYESPVYIKLGFKPSFISVTLYGQDSGQYQSMISTFTDINSQKYQRFYNTSTGYTRVCEYGQRFNGGFVHSIDDNGFYIQCLEPAWANTDLVYMAMK